MSVSNPRIEVKDAATAGWFGVREEANLPVRGRGPAHGASYRASSDTHDASSRASGWLRRARRMAMDLVLVLAAITTVPVVAVTISSREWWRSGVNVGNSRAKLRRAEASRQFGVPKDASITPMEAGRSFAALQPLRTSREFPLVDVPHPDATWRNLTIGPGMFPTARPPHGFSAPEPQTILEAAAHGFSAEEMSYLQKLATAPIWRDFDRVARAGAVDMVGGEFVVPFAPQAVALEIPSAAFLTTKDIAWTALSRAAYHLAIGQRDSAETILRSIVSYGFGIVDNGVGLTYQGLGDQIVEIGRDGLERFYVLTRDPRASSVRVRRPVSFAGPETVFDWHRPGISIPPTADQIRQELIARVMDPRESRGVRFSALEVLSFSSCTNVRELLFGQRADVRDAFERAKHELARYPSEQAFIDLIQRAPKINAFGMGSSTFTGRFLLGTSEIAGAVLRNPRLTECAWHVTNGRMSF